MAAIAKQYKAKGIPATNGSSAYDYERYGEAGTVKSKNIAEQDAKTVRKTVKKTVKRKTKAKQNVSTFALVGYSTVILLLFLTVFSHVKLYEQTNKLSSLQNELTDLKDQEAKLSSKYESLVDLKKVETEATGKYNMTQPQTNQVQYVDLSNADKAVVVKNSSSSILGVIYSSICNFCTNIKEYIE